MMIPRGLLVAVLMVLAGCDIESRAEEGWPCDATRPCATGWFCGLDNTCRLGEAALAVAPNADAETTGADAAGGQGGDTSCTPFCPPGTCGDDSCGGSCGPCPIAVEVAFEVPGVEPRGLAFSGDGIWVGDNTERVVRLFDPASGTQIGSKPLPEGVLRDLAWDSNQGRLVAVMADPAGFWAIFPGSEPQLLAENTTAHSMAFDGTHFLTVEGGQLKRWNPNTFQVEMATTVSSGCEQLAATTGRVYRWCGTEGHSGNYTPIIEKLDSSLAQDIPLLETIILEADVSDIHGMDISGDSLWILGRGYGALAGKVAQVKVSP